MINYYRLNTRYSSAHYFNDSLKSLCGNVDAGKNEWKLTNKPKRCLACLAFPAAIHGIGLVELLESATFR